MEIASVTREHPFTEQDLEYTALLPQYRVDLRNAKDEKLDRFFNANMVSDWSELSWDKVGRPFEVKKLAKERVDWESEHGQAMPVKTSWEHFNRSFHSLFMQDVPAEQYRLKATLKDSFKGFRMQDVKHGLGEMVRLSLWNYVHRIEDGIWDPRGKRALFEGLDVTNPRILFLGAAEGYEAMQLHAMYPGGEVVMVDYDEFCKTDRFGHFPETYPFLGTNPETGGRKVWYKDQMNITYLVKDIRDLDFHNEFDIVLSVGLLEHVPDEHKPAILDWHRKFVKPNGYVIMTTPRNQVKSKLYYHIMADIMNHTYRELMDIRQMGLYAYENGFDILRHGYIKVHNGIVARAR